jgi:hypothetical protein
MLRKSLYSLLIVLLLPTIAFSQKNQQPANKLVTDSAGQKAQTQKAIATKKPTAKANIASPGKQPATTSLSNSDTAFLALARDILELRAKYENLMTASGNAKDPKKAGASKTDTFGFLSLHDEPPFKVGLYLDGKPFKDSSKLTPLLALDSAKRKSDSIRHKRNDPIQYGIKGVPDEALLSLISVDSIQVYMKNTYITRLVLFCGRSIYQSHDQIDVSEIDDHSTLARFQIDNTMKQIRISDLLLYGPWHDDNNNNVKDSIYLLSSMDKIKLPTQ